MTTRTAYRTCSLCEATCGLRIDLDGDGPEARVVAVRGDDEHVFSHGYVCPKGVAIGEVHHDPSRLRQPLVRQPDGSHRPVTWDEAWAEVRRLLLPLLREHGPDAVGLYLGNPNVHNVASTLYVPALVRALGTGYRFSASTVDQMPKQVASGLMFGTELSVPVPDVDRTDLLLVLGANPVVSNGSLLTAPDMPGRLRALRARGGRLVVVDPVRTRTAQVADEHVAIRPGTDAFWLAAVANVLLADGLADPGAAAPFLAEGSLDAVRDAVAPFGPETVEPVTGVPAATTRRLAGDLAAAPTAAVYGRMGTTTAGHLDATGRLQSFATLASWLVDVVNTLTGNLDRPGGVLWPRPAAGGLTTQGEPGRGRGIRVPGSRRTRVSGVPSVLGEFPAALLAEEIDTPGPAGERLRGLVVVAGNPVLSVPDSARLEAALGTLEVMVSVDSHLTETSRHANVVLPVPSPLERGHYDLVFAQLAVRNVAAWSPATLPPPEGQPDEAEVLLGLAAVGAEAASGQPVSPDQVDELVLARVLQQVTADPSSALRGQDLQAVRDLVAGRRGVERLLDLMLRAGPYDLTLADLEAAPHGVDLGPLEPRLPDVLRTPSGHVELAPAQVLADVPRLAEALAAGPPGPIGPLRLVGRRQLRSNNSWLHGTPLLAGGSNRCTLQVHPYDADARGLADGRTGRLTSAAGSVEVVIEVTDVVAPGVVCLPHGWGHLAPGTWNPVAAREPGVNVNLVHGAGGLDPLAGTAVLNGTPVALTAES